MIFEKIIVVGTSRLLCCCALESQKYLPTEVIENAHSPENKALYKALAGVPCRRSDKLDTMDYLDGIAEKTLVVSALNTYLFPKRIIEKNNMTIMNFHPALLPKYPGRNSEAWVIFDGEIETGITWHFIDENVDNGFAVIQKNVTVEQNDTAASLFAKLLKKGEECFGEILTRVLDDTVVKTPLNTNPADIKLSKDIPNNGYFDLNWDFEKAGRFLRCMDFGFRPQFPAPRIIINDNSYLWKKYVIKNTPNRVCGMEVEDDNAVINYENGTIILKKLALSDRQS